MKWVAFVTAFVSALIAVSVAAADQTGAGNLGKPDQVLRTSGTSGQEMVSTAQCSDFAPGDVIVFATGTFASDVKYWLQTPFGFAWRTQETQIEETATVGAFAYSLRAHLSFDGAAESDEVGVGRVTIARSDGRRMTGQAFLDYDPITFTTGVGYSFVAGTVHCR